MNNTTNILCYSCSKEFEPKREDSSCANGFFDKDLEEYVHFGDCRIKFYLYKKTTEFSGMYSEIPFLLPDNKKEDI